MLTNEEIVKKLLLLSDLQLVELVNQLNQQVVQQDSNLRKICIDLFGNDSIEAFIQISFFLLNEVTSRMRIYSPHIHDEIFF